MDRYGINYWELLLLLLSSTWHSFICFYASVSGVHTTIKISPTAYDTKEYSVQYIILSLLGHWLLPLFTPQLCMTPHDIWSG